MFSNVSQVDPKRYRVTSRGTMAALMVMLTAPAAVFGQGAATALHFDGMDDYISIPHDPSLNLTGNYSIELFLRPDGTFDASASDYQGLLDKGDYQMYLDPGDGKLKFVQPSAGTFSARFAPNFNGPVYAMVSYNNELIVAGDFTMAGGATCNHIARWDRNRWLPIGYGTDGPVYALDVYQAYGDSVPLLYIGGDFTTAGGISSPHLAAWNAYTATWQMRSDLIGGPVYAITHDTGGYMYVGGRGASYHVYQFGTSSSPLATGMAGQDPTVYALRIYDNSLYAGGQFEVSAYGQTTHNIARWAGSTWMPVVTNDLGTNDTVYALAVYDDDLYVGGSFTTAGGLPAMNLARFDFGTSAWIVLPVQITDAGRSVRALGAFTSPYSTGLWVGGDFASIGGAAVNGIAQWNGATWSVMVEGVSGDEATVYAFGRFDFGGVYDLYVGGRFDGVGGEPSRNLGRLISERMWEPVGTGTNGRVYALQSFDDDASGPHAETLYAGGYFATAGGVTVNNIAKWDGAAWSALGSGVVGSVCALAVFDDDGDGPQPPALYAGGDFNNAGGTWVSNIAKWDGAAWSALGSGLSQAVNALAVYDDDGPGPHLPALYAGGYFTYVAKWNGTSWSSVGTISGFSPVHVDALTVYDDDGAGPHPELLIAGGRFEVVGGTGAANIAQWNGTSWSPFASGSMWGIGGIVYSLMAYDDDGAGPHLPALYVGGSFTTAGGGSAANVAKWNGTTWSALGTGTNGPVLTFGSFDFDGTGPQAGVLCVGGDFTYAGEIVAVRLATWDGTAWGYPGGADGAVRALLLFDEDGAGPEPSTLYMGGDFDTAGNVTVNSIAKWGGPEWQTTWYGMDDTVQDFATWSPSPEETYLVAGGQFETAGQVSGTKSLACWQKDVWVVVPAFWTNGDVFALASQSDLASYVGGSFTQVGSGISTNNIALWSESSQWYALGAGTNGTVHALAYDDSAITVYAVGVFTTAGGAPANNIAQYTTTWSALGDGLTSGDSPGVFALLLHDYELYAGGQFTQAGGQPADNIAKWNGSAWSALGAGTNGPVYAIVFFNGEIVVGGSFTSAGGVSANCLAKWNGTTWTALGDGVSGGEQPTVKALAVYNNELYVGGEFTLAGDVPASYLAKWDGMEWIEVGSGTNGTVEALHTHGTELWIGGSFSMAGGLDSRRVAVWTQPVRTLASARTTWAAEQHHVAITNDGANLHMYVNGVLETTVAASGVGGEATARPLRIGAIRPRTDSGTGQFFIGQIDEVRVWNEWRTETELRDNLNRKLGGTEAGLVAYYRFDEGAGTTADDSSPNDNDGALLGPTWATSTAPLGDAAVWATGTAPGALSSPYGDSFEITSLTGSPPFVALIRVDGPPNSTQVDLALYRVFGSHYFEVWIPAGGSPIYTAVYHYLGHPAITDENALALASRPDATTTVWQDTAAVLETGANTLTATGQTGTQYDLGERGVALTMAVSPPGAGTANPPVGVPTPYPVYGTADVHAIPSPGYIFDHWTSSAGAAPVPNLDCPADATMLMDVAKTVTAFFMPGPVIESHWTGGTACPGFAPEECWNLGSNWCPQIAPDNVAGSGFDVSISSGTVALNMSATIDDLLLDAGTVVVNNASGATVRTLAVVNPITNQGTFRATDDRRLVLDAPQIEQTVGGLLQVDNGGVIQINGALVTGGTARTLDCDSNIELIGGAEFNNVTIESDCGRADSETVIVPDAQSGVLGGSIQNDGGVRVAADLDITTLAPAVGGVTLSGSGSVVLANQDLAWFGAFGRTINNAASHTIEGAGLVWGHLTNEGTVKGNIEGQGLTVSSPGNKTNNGLFQASNGGTLWIGDDVAGTGDYQADGGTIWIEAAKSGLSVMGTSLLIANGGKVQVVGSPEFTLTGAATISVGGTYQGGSGSSAGLHAANVSITADGVNTGGQMILTDSMRAVVVVGTTVDGLTLCQPGRGCTPPILDASGSASITTVSMDLLNGGQVRLGGNAAVVISDVLTVTSGGVFGGGSGSAALVTAGSVVVANGDSEGGQVVLQGTMDAQVTGDMRADYSPCKGGQRGCTPPVLDIISSGAVLRVEGSLVLAGQVELQVQSESVYLSGDFDNASDAPGIFDWSGGLILDGESSQGPQLFEAAGENLGAAPAGWTNNFSIGRVEVATGAYVKFVDHRDNCPTCQGDCSEAVYIGTLVLRSGSFVELDLCRVYCHELIDEGAEIQDNGCGPILAAPVGDLNCDGAVNVADVPHFVQALVDPTGYDADHDGDPNPVCECARADLKVDGFVNALDIQVFVDLLLDK